MLLLIFIIDPHQKLNEDSDSVSRLLRRGSAHDVDLVTPLPPPPPHHHHKCVEISAQIPLIFGLGLMCVNNLQCSNMIWMVI